MDTVVELKRKETKGLGDFLDAMSEEELLSALDGSPALSEGTSLEITGVEVSSASSPVELEKNSRLTLIKMMEMVPEMGRPFTFYVRRWTGDAYIQSIRTEISRARKWAKDNGYEFDEPFRLVKVGIQTHGTYDAVTLMRLPKGKHVNPRLEGLMKLMGGSNVGDEE